MSDNSNYLHSYSANTELSDHADDRRASYENLKNVNDNTTGYTELKHTCLKCDQGVVETHQNDIGITLISEVTDWNGSNAAANGRQNKGNETNTEEAQRSCKKRLVCFIVFGILILVAATTVVLVLTVFSKESTNKLTTTKTSTTTSTKASTTAAMTTTIYAIECADVYVSLGEDFIMSCTFDLTHEYRTHLRAATNVTTIKQGFDSSNFYATIVPSVPLNTDMVVWQIEGPNATCTTDGDYTLQFKDGDNKLIHTAKVRVFLETSKAITSMTQVRLSYMNDTTLFTLHCAITKDCNNYDIHFVAGSNSDSAVRAVYIDDGARTCTTTYTNEHGNSFNCTKRVMGDKILGMRYVGCRLSVDDRMIHQQEIVFPECEPVCAALFNCTDTSEELKALRDGDCDNTKITQCYPAGRDIQQFKICHESEPQCVTNSTVCRLDWCMRSTGRLAGLQPGGIPGIELCNRTFVEPQATTTTTTTTPATTTTTTTYEEQITEPHTNNIR